MGDQAGAFIGRWRTPQRSRGRRQRNQATVVHRLDLPAQQQGLLARLQAWAFLQKSPHHSPQRVEAKVDARRKHETVVAERGAVGETDRPRLRIDLDCGCAMTVTPSAAILS